MNPKEFYLHCLKDGPQKHNNVYGRMKNRFDCDPTAIRNELVASGHIRESGSTKRKDGKTVFIYELTGKKFVKETAKAESMTWEDGTMKSKCNAFDWKNNARGLFGKNELAAIDVGRKMGLNGTKNNQVNVYSRAGV